MIKRPGHDVKLTLTKSINQLMFESILGIVLPVVKDLLWAAAGMALTYLINKIQSNFQHI
jgi:hypothetical protein